MPSRIASLASFVWFLVLGSSVSAQDVYGVDNRGRSFSGYRSGDTMYLRDNRGTSWTVTTTPDYLAIGEADRERRRRNIDAFAETLRRDSEESDARHRQRMAEIDRTYGAGLQQPGLQGAAPSTPRATAPRHPTMGKPVQALTERKASSQPKRPAAVAHSGPAQLVSLHERTSAKAASELEMARALIRTGNNAAARTRLERIVAIYGSTDEARAADGLLKDLR